MASAEGEDRGPGHTWITTLESSALEAEDRRRRAGTAALASSECDDQVWISTEGSTQGPVRLRFQDHHSAMHVMRSSLRARVW